MSGFRPAIEGDREAWQSLLARCASGDFLHDWAWDAVAEYDGEPRRRFLLERGGEVVGIVAAQVRRTPLGRSFWYVPHGPVLDWAAAAARGELEAIVDGLRNAGSADGVIAVKLEPRVEAGDAVAAGVLGAARLRTTRHHVQIPHTRIVDIGQDDHALLASFDKDTRYAVRRAEREGVTVSCTSQPADRRAIDELHGLVTETQRRAGFPLPPAERYRIAWQSLAEAGRAVILEARRGEDLLASGMLVVEGDRSFYLFSGSRREEPGDPKHYASYALQWEMMRVARGMGSRSHDLWGIAPPGAGRDHPWFGVGLFKKGFGGRAVEWVPSRDVVVSPLVYAARGALASLRTAVRRGRR